MLRGHGMGRTGIRRAIPCREYGSKRAVPLARRKVADYPTEGIVVAIRSGIRCAQRRQVVTVLINGRSAQYGDLLLDQECLFAIRGGSKVHFTRHERSVLFALTRNPHQLMTRHRLLDELAADEDRSDRYIDFLVNRLRAKLGDDPRSPKFIQTRYGEGYVWAAAPGTVAPLDALLVMATGPAAGGQEISHARSAVLERLRQVIGAGVSPERAIVVDEDWRPGADDKVGHHLLLHFRASGEGIACLATLREIPTRRITASCRVDLRPQNGLDFAVEADALSRSILTALGKATTGLGLAPGNPAGDHRHEASIVLLGANPRWAGGIELAEKRARDPSNTDLAFQWCFHLFSRLTVASPFEPRGLAEREGMETEIEAITLEHLPAAEDNPLHMFAAAKLLYFVDRGHLDLAEDLAERALARTGDPTGSFALMGQLRCARGRFDEAIAFFDRGERRLDLGRDFQLHIRAMKCVALLAAGRRDELAVALAGVDLAPPCPPHIASMMDWTFSPHERPLSDASANALAAVGPAGAANAIEYSWFTSVRQIVSHEARANVLRGLIAQVVRTHGPTAVPNLVARAIGWNSAA